MTLINKQAEACCDDLPTYGGQAVIEGVMMRGSNAVAIAMRSPENEIVTHIEELGGIYKSRLTKIPFLRGLVLLWDALVLGMRALTISANLQTDEEEEIEGPVLYATVGIAIAIAIGLFFLAPAAIGQWAEKLFTLNAWWSNVIEGVVRLLFIIGYIWAVSFMPDVRRVFAYHGAEHKTINAFEDGVELTPESVALYSVEHPRCGTAFLLTLAILSMLVFTLLGPMSLVWRLVSRVLLIPVLSGLSYEYIRWTSKHADAALIRALAKPNLALQKLTTREPSLEIIEVSIAAFKAMRSAEQKMSA
jgi:uncharacterized protein YqhQ